MLTFFITASIMLVAAYADFRGAETTKQMRLTVFYTILLCISLVLVALHCFGVHLDDIRAYSV